MKVGLETGEDKTMKHKYRPNTLTNAPLQYAPENEMGVVFLFAHVARKLQFRVEQVRPGFPDCIAYKRTGDREKRIRIEFEYRSSNFRAHRHDPKGCDCVVCWHHDWPDAPNSIEVIELKRYFGAAVKVWIQPVRKDWWQSLDEYDEMSWGLSKRATPGDLLLMYRCSPEKRISDIFILQGELSRSKAGWREGDCYAGWIKRLCSLPAPIFWEDMRDHTILSTSYFVRGRMQGNLLVSEYWPHLHAMIVARNPRLDKTLARYAPERM
ncbi:MAG TPA: hypothetical protein PLU87_04890 [Sedimentisphaerales bacterium]|nr:hypothetical protein [Sedimentisphaerales bacterium]HRS11230.1 hypothetical protein [Sedimentisphaerales bacterium]HRV47808.1 hypothetical protein [Sedimentisphaerales bacterium]